MQSFESRFPHAGIKNIKIYYWLTLLTSCWFVEGNWFFFWTKFISVTQLGLLFALLTVLNLVLEIPTGALADKIGRKKVIVLAFLFEAVGLLILSLSFDIWSLTLGGIIHTTGMALFSGSMEALIYDTMLEQKNEAEYDKVVAKSDQIAIVTSAVTIIAGGAMYLVNFRLPYLMWAGATFGAMILSMKIRETDFSTEMIGNYLGKLVDGTKQLFINKLRPYLILVFLLLGVYYVYDWGLVKPEMAIQFGFYSNEQSVVWAVTALLGTWLLGKLPLIRKRVRNNLLGVRMVTLMMASGFLLGFFPIGWWGFGALLLIEMAGTLAYPWISIIVNQEIDSGHRATTLSALSFVTKIPYVLSMVLISEVVAKDEIKWVSFIIGLLIILGVGIGKITEKYYNLKTS